MRTRLDEIVDGVYRDGGSQADRDKLIADRAFRHGVEQAGRWVQAYIDLSVVQPAPEEEKRPFDVTGFQGHLHGVDRRKAERRLGSEAKWLADLCGLYGPVFFNGVGVVSDRRLKDRRKP